MSINPETLFAGKINPSDADYPYGSARNITTPGDGTGTPWDSALVNDLFGFQQALLNDAGIVPSGTPDKLGASQYLQSLFKSSGLVRANYTVLRLVTSSELSDLTNCLLTTDGIDGPFVLDKSDTTTADDGGTVIVDADGGRWKRPVINVVSLGYFEPVRDGATDDLAKFNAAGALGVPVFVPDGSYAVTANPTGIFYGPGLVTNTTTGDKVFVRHNFDHVSVTKGTIADLANAQTELGALVVINHEDSTGPALDIVNAGDRAAGNNAQPGIIIHHYSDGIPQQIDNVGINNSLVIKQARNATRRSDKASSFVGTGPFVAFTRASDGSADPHTGVPQNVTRFNALGDLQFDADTSHRNSARSVHAVGDIQVTGEIIEVGNASDTAFSGTLDQKPIETSTLVITDTVETFTETGTGVLTGDLGGSGTIVYSTGAWSVTFNTAPANLQDITADYQYGQNVRISTRTGNLFLQANQIGRMENYVIYPENMIRLPAVVTADAATANPGSGNPAIGRDSVSAIPVFWAGNRYKDFAVMDKGSVAYAGGTINAGLQIIHTVTVTGAGLGQFAVGSYDLDLQGLTISAYVSGANTVKVVMFNGTAGNITLAAGTVRARAIKSAD